MLLESCYSYITIEVEMEADVLNEKAIYNRIGTLYFYKILVQKFSLGEYRFSPPKVIDTNLSK